MDFPSSDADMNEQTLADAPEARSLFPETPRASGTQQPLFLAGTPSAAGTPRRSVPMTPAARQARTPLFAGSERIHRDAFSILTRPSVVAHRVPKLIPGQASAFKANEGA
jgi:hypothetical protein